MEDTLARYFDILILFCSLPLSCISTLSVALPLSTYPLEFPFCSHIYSLLHSSSLLNQAAHAKLHLIPPVVIHFPFLSFIHSFIHSSLPVHTYSILPATDKIRTRLSVFLPFFFFLSLLFFFFSFSTTY
ncbi:hypothetical protein BDW59DRAFT_61588 [Aspergillus cavernicola]|uniref:Uncharacterized protein n=1 Tax=Aspergillus cavernicola TaxID=176166 RepID=A0ABR4IGF5_9EURO